MTTRYEVYRRLNQCHESDITFTDVYCENVAHRMGAGGGWRIHFVTDKQLTNGSAFVAHPSLFIARARTEEAAREKAQKLKRWLKEWERDEKL